MSGPRMNGSSTVSICARMKDGRPFLIPSREVNELVEYAFGVACEKTGARIVSCKVMVNHYHMELEAPAMNSSAFCYVAHRIITDGLKARYNRRGGVWDGDRLMIAGVYDREGLARCVEYTQTNSVRDGVAKCPEEHLGFRIGPEMAGETRRVLRPDRLFSVDSTWPEAATYTVATPDTFLREGETTEEFRDRLVQRVEARTALELKERAKRHSAPAGRKTMRRRYATMRREKAWLREPAGEQEKRRAWSGQGMPAWIAGSETTRRVLRKRHARFLELYRLALELWRRDPDDEVEFPHGTLKMAGAPNVRVSTEPPDE